MIDINFDETRLAKIFQQLSTKKYENDYRAIDCFRMFWTYHKSSIYLYELKGHSVWQAENEDFYSGFFVGLNEVFKTIKPVIDATKK